MVQDGFHGQARVPGRKGSCLEQSLFSLKNRVNCWGSGRCKWHECYEEGCKKPAEQQQEM